MANFETAELSGALFKATKREGKQDPDYSGNCKIGGVEFNISAWLNESKNGVKYFGLKFRERQPKQVATEPAPAKQEELNDEIPF